MDYYVLGDLIKKIEKKSSERYHQINKKIKDLEEENKLLKNNNDYDALYDKYENLKNLYDQLLNQINNLKPQQINNLQPQQINMNNLSSQDNLNIPPPNNLIPPPPPNNLIPPPPPPPKNLIPPPPPNNLPKPNIGQNKEIECMKILNDLGLDINNKNEIQIWLKNNINSPYYNNLLKCLKIIAQKQVPVNNKMSENCLQILQSLNIDPDKPASHVAWLTNPDNKLLPNYQDVKNCLSGKSKAPIKQTVNINISEQCKQLYDKYQLNPLDNAMIQNWLIVNFGKPDYKSINDCQKEYSGTNQVIKPQNTKQQNFINYLNNLRQFLITAPGNIFDCNKENFGINIDKANLVIGQDVNKITLIVTNDNNIKLAIKLWFSKLMDFNARPDIPQEFYIYGLLRNDPNFASKYRHMEILLAQNQCDNTIQYVSNLLTVKCPIINKNNYACDVNVRNDINNNQYNKTVKYGISRFAELGTVLNLLGSEFNNGTLKYGNTSFNLFKEPLWIMSIILQMLWQIDQLSYLGIVVRDLHIDNILVYYDINYDKNSKKYYKYEVNGKNFFIKVQPIILKIIDYGLFLVNVPQDEAIKKNTAGASTFISIHAGMGPVIQSINPNYNNIFDGPNDTSLFNFVRNSNNLNDPIEFYLNKIEMMKNYISTLQNQSDYIKTNMNDIDINDIIGDHISS